MSATRDLARFVAGTGYADLPPDVRHATRRCLVNATGVALHAAGDPALEILLGAFRDEGGARRATVWGTGTRSPLLLAALANGFLIHLDDFDDTHFPTVVHPSAPVIPVALALGEARRLPARDVLTAVALGVEVCCRVALGVHPWHYDAGWHITGTAGVFGAAAAAGRLLGLEAGPLAACFGIAGTQAAGVREVFGTMTKALHAGRAAQSGLLAALLAERGFSAPETILEGRRGFGAVLSARHDFARATEGLGQTWEIHNNGFKPYACGVVIHPLIDACLALRQRPGVRPEDVSTVEARVHPLVLELVDRPTIRSGLEGKFSVQHGIAVALVDGAAGPAQFEDRKAGDPLLAALRGTVTLVQDETLSEDAAAVRLTLRDGRTLEQRVEHATGSPGRPMTDAQLSDKFRALAGPRLSLPGAEALLSALWRFDALDALPDFGAGP
jgi:2-methylcitrate dehydratase PrpD